MVRLIKIFERIVRFLGVLTLLAFAVCVILQIIFRYILKISVPWTEGMARIFLIWLTVIGIAVVASEKSQIRTSFLVAKLPIPYQKLWNTIITFLSILFLIIFWIGSLQMIPVSMDLVWGSIPWIKESVIYMPQVILIPIAILFLIHRYKNFEKFDKDL